MPRPRLDSFPVSFSVLSEHFTMLCDLGLSTPKQWPGGPAPDPTRSASIGLRRLFALVDPAVIQSEIGRYQAEYDARVAYRAEKQAKIRERDAKRDAMADHDDWQLAALMELPRK